MVSRSTAWRALAKPLTLAWILLHGPSIAQPAGRPPQESEAPTVTAPTFALESALARAERDLAANEMEAAESAFRSVLLEGWLLLGGLEAAEQHLDLAARAFDKAAVSAAETRRADTARAVLALRQGDHERAIELLRRVSLQHPDSGEIRRLLAQALVVAGRPDEAIQELEETMARNDEDPETAFALGSGYLRVGKVAEAERLLETVALARPIPQTWVLIGRTYRDFQEYDRARASFERALAMDADVRRARYYLGTIELLSRGRDGLDAAVPLFEAELERFPEDPMTNLYLGLALAEDRRFEEAIQPLRLAAAWPTSRLDALRFLGRCYMGVERSEEAENTLREALDLAREQGSPRQLSRTHYQLALTLRRLGRPDEAEPHFEAARESSTELVDAERDRFERFLSDAGQIEPRAAGSDAGYDSQGLGQLPAETRLAVRARLEGALARSYFNLGTMQARSGQFERALELFQSAAAIDGDFPALQRALGVTAFNAGEFVTAATHLDLADRQEGGSPDLKRMQALAWLNLEEYDRAAALLASETLRGSDPALEYSYGLALARGGHPETAQVVFDRLVQQHAEWPELHVLLGQAYAEQEDFESAVSSLRRALELNAGVADANFTLGEIFMRQGRLDEAEQVLRAELAGRPDAARVRYLLAVVLDLANRPQEATEELESVLAAQPDNADARYLLGKIRLATGEAPEAALHLEAAAFLAPGDSNIRYQLAQALQRLGEREKAAEQFEVYRRLKREEREDQP